eukprot:4262352-Amphidinium_carterae.2
MPTSVVVSEQKEGCTVKLNLIVDGNEEESAANMTTEEVETTLAVQLSASCTKIASEGRRRVGSAVALLCFEEMEVVAGSEHQRVKADHRRLSTL